MATKWSSRPILPCSITSRSFVTLSASAPMASRRPIRWIIFSGFTLANDVSAREIQQREVASGSRFWTAKNMPGFAPVGPFILTMDEVADTDNLWVPWGVNGKRRLRANTGDYLYKI